MELQFQLPQGLSGADARYADVPVVRATVRLGPETLRSFTAGDCQLLRQLSTLLLPALPLHRVGPELTCPVVSAARRPFALEVQALIPRS